MTQRKDVMPKKQYRKGCMTATKIVVQTGEVIQGKQAISSFMGNKYRNRQNFEATLLKNMLAGEDIKSLATRKELSVDYLRSIFSHASHTATIQTSAQLQVMLLSRVAGLASDSDRKWLYIQDLMREIEKAEEAGVQWFEIEKIEGVGRDADGTQTKQIPISEAKKRLYDQMIKCHQDLLDGIKPFMPKHVIHTDGDALNEETAANIEKEIAELEQLKEKKERSKNENAA